MTNKPPATSSYKSSGVDIDAGSALVEAIKPLAQSTTRPGVMGQIGGFGALFDLKKLGYRDPLLVASTDGVGTKLKLASAAGQHHDIGLDLVAMCVNDISALGAEPLFFLDYYASARLDTNAATDVVTGIAEGCRQAGCALIGGETAEMPGHYAVGDYDLAGFVVGAVERDAVLPNVTLPVSPGDVVLGLASNGAHANGFSLIRRIMADRNLHVDDAAPFAPDLSLGATLLAPTRIYVKACIAAQGSGGIKAWAHITGGGITENLARVLPAGCGAHLDGKSWSIQPLFSWIRAAGQVPTAEMFSTFNCGIGMMAVVATADVETVTSLLAKAGETVKMIGKIVPIGDSAPAVEIQDAEKPWR